MIRWSERLFVLTSFGIIVCSEMNRDSIEFPTLFTYTMMSNIVSNKAHAKLSNFESTLRSAFSLACAFKSFIFQILTILPSTVCGHFRCLNAQTGLFSYGLATRSPSHWPALLPQFLCPLHGVRVDDDSGLSNL